MTRAGPADGALVQALLDGAGKETRWRALRKERGGRGGVKIGGKKVRVGEATKTCLGG